MRRLLSAGVAVGAAVLLSGSALLAPSTSWEADTSRGTSVFEGVEEKPGSVDVVDDPKGEHGSVYRMHTSGEQQGSERVRVETRGHRTADGDRLRFTEGDTYYIGWESMWDPLPTADGEWVALWQLKDYGSGAATPPLSLRARGDVLDLEYNDPDLKTTRLWEIPMPRQSWNSFVVGVHISSDPGQGWVRFWYNGEEQLLDGQEQFSGATLRADFVTDKWGVYRSDGVKGEATAYLANAKVGTSYADVAPQSDSSAGEAVDEEPEQ
ncbi:heparin lyase I family protein [Saccharopolyspora sp. NPDC002686]|uniref:heparin lyase I family protein n=1 Tax=Saccharopolyspora sp. NPDC002686 TaxID=3154541 RepID=UPI00331D59E0